MSRKPMIAGNWKMNKNHQEAVSFVKEIKDKVPSEEIVDTVIAAPSLFLQAMGEETKGTAIKLAAQNCYHEDEGAYTGETSPKALSALDIDYVVIGHSERREYFHETDEDINLKAKEIFKNGMVPIICCGETLEQREAGETADFVSGQVKNALADLTPGQLSQVVIAYEPIWAIGTGKSSSAADANETCGVVRQTLAEVAGQEIADSVRVLYGGSVKPENIADYMKEEHIDGALVGGASLEEDSFLGLLEVIE